MTNTRTFDVIVKCYGKWWTFEVPKLNAIGHAIKLSDIESEAHHVIATRLNIDSKTVNVNVTVEGQEPQTARQSWDEAEQIEEAARKQQAQAAAMRRRIVKGLRANNYSAGDVGTLLGISRQRVYQLEKTTT